MLPPGRANARREQTRLGVVVFSVVCTILLEPFGKC